MNKLKYLKLTPSFAPDDCAVIEISEALTVKVPEMITNLVCMTLKRMDVEIVSIRPVNKDNTMYLFKVGMGHMMNTCSVGCETITEYRSICELTKRNLENEITKN